MHLSMLSTVFVVLVLSVWLEIESCEEQVMVLYID